MTTFDQTHLERQLSSLFRAEAQDTHLPLGTWQEIVPKMGEPDRRSLPGLIRHAIGIPWAEKMWRNPMRVRYVAPAATVVLAIIIALLFVLLVNDTDDDGPIPAGTPTIPAGTAEPLGTPTLVPTFTPLPVTATAVPTATSQPTQTPTAVPTAQPSPTEAAPTPEPTSLPLPTATPVPFGVTFLPLSGQTIRRAESTLWITENLVGYKEIDESGSVLRSFNAPRGDIGVSDFVVVGEELWTDSQDLDPSIRIKIFDTDGSVTRIEHSTFYSNVENRRWWYLVPNRKPDQKVFA